MTFCRVVGNLVATQKKKELVGSKLMIVQPIDNFGKDVGDEMIAVDCVGAGIGDLVIVIYEGWAARWCARAKSNTAPIETVIAGIIDSYETDVNSIFQK